MERMTIKSLAGIGSFMILALALSVPARAQEFSADMITHGEDGKVSKGRFYRAANKERLDSTVERGGRTFGTYMIVDLREKLIYLVEPEKKRIMMSHFPTITGAGGRVSSTVNACEEWMRAVDPTLPERASRCSQLGSESVNGRATTKWQMEWQVDRPGLHKSPTAFLWTDSQTKAVIKWTLPGGVGGELQNIRVGRQSLSLFELPDYAQKPGGAGIR